MTESRREAVREFRLEGLGLIVIAAALLAAFVGAFYLGRWYERRSAPVDAILTTGQDPLGQVAGAAGDEPGSEADVDAGLTFFDQLGEGEKAEPRREAAPAQAVVREAGAAGGPSEARPEEPAPAAAADPGAFDVQVFAGRDQISATRLRRQLEGQGYQVEVAVENQGSDRLFKVRAVGYADRAAADRAAKALRAGGFPGAFVRQR